mmetsp:Transcript_49995/g.119357  ORF Transcript_49995/g.119357 Transcript_49995/m.119357 type:complete len:282 (-) Transcript_49995:2459-3304(-)
MRGLCLLGLALRLGLDRLQRRFLAVVKVRLATGAKNLDQSAVLPELHSPPGRQEPLGSQLLRLFHDPTIHEGILLQGQGMHLWLRKLSVFVSCPEVGKLSNSSCPVLVRHVGVRGLDDFEILFCGHRVGTLAMFFDQLLHGLEHGIGFLLSPDWLFLFRVLLALQLKLRQDPWPHRPLLIRCVWQECNAQRHRPLSAGIDVLEKVSVFVDLLLELLTPVRRCIGHNQLQRQIHLQVVEMLLLLSRLSVEVRSECRLQLVRVYRRDVGEVLEAAVFTKLPEI